MGIFTAFSNLFAGRSFSKISVDQEKALIDSLTYAMAIDYQVSPSEEEELANALRNVDWKESLALDAFGIDDDTQADISNQLLRETSF